MSIITFSVYLPYHILFDFHLQQLQLFEQWLKYIKLPLTEMTWSTQNSFRGFQELDSVILITQFNYESNIYSLPLIPCPLSLPSLPCIQSISKPRTSDNLHIPSCMHVCLQPFQKSRLIHFKWSVYLLRFFLLYKVPEKRLV